MNGRKANGKQNEDGEVCSASLWEKFQGALLPELLRELPIMSAEASCNLHTTRPVDPPTAGPFYM